MADEAQDRNHLPDDYFIQQFGVDHSFDWCEKALYSEFPSHHRALIESAIENPKCRDISLNTLHEALEILADGIYRTRRKRPSSEESIRLEVSSVMRIRKAGFSGVDVEPGMHLESIAEMLYPLHGFESLKDKFITVISELVEGGILRALVHDDSIKVFLPEAEKVAADYLPVQEQQCLKVWRAYLHDSEHEPQNDLLSMEGTTEQSSSSTPQDEYDLFLNNIDDAAIKNFVLSMPNWHIRALLKWEEVNKEIENREFGGFKEQFLEKIGPDTFRRSINEFSITESAYMILEGKPLAVPLWDEYLLLANSINRTSSFNIEKLLLLVFPFYYFYENTLYYKALFQGESGYEPDEISYLEFKRRVDESLSDHALSLSMLELWTLYTTESERSKVPQKQTQKNEKYSLWNAEIIERWDANPHYKTKIQVCDDMVEDLEALYEDEKLPLGFNIPTAKHIANMTSVTSGDLKARRKKHKA